MLLLHQRVAHYRGPTDGRGNVENAKFVSVAIMHISSVLEYACGLYDPVDPALFFCVSFFTPSMIPLRQSSDKRSIFLRKSCTDLVVNTQAQLQQPDHA